MFMSSEMVTSSDELMTISSQRNNNFCGEYTRKYCFGKFCIEYMMTWGTLAARGFQICSSLQSVTLYLLSFTFNSY